MFILEPLPPSEEAEARSSLLPLRRLNHTEIQKQPYVTSEHVLSCSPDQNRS